MQYMVIKNNIVTGIFCGECDDENSIRLPDTHEVREGETLDFYNKDNWTRKSEVELIKLGLSEPPVGYKLDNDQIVEMTFNDRIIAGLDPLPSNLKIVDGKLVEKSEQELFDGFSLEEKEVYIRSIRDGYMQKILNKISRYQLQKELGTETTNSEEWYKSALEYLEYLRNIPQQLDFPNNLKIKEPPK